MQHRKAFAAKRKPSSTIECRQLWARRDQPVPQSASEILEVQSI